MKKFVGETLDMNHQSRRYGWWQARTLEAGVKGNSYETCKYARTGPHDCNCCTI